jgi:hypothetical protein
MFDHQEDRDRYEAFIHAIYKKYDLEHDAGLAEKGALILDDALLSTTKNRILPCRN